MSAFLQPEWCRFVTLCEGKSSLTLLFDSGCGSTDVLSVFVHSPLGLSVVG